MSVVPQMWQQVALQEQLQRLSIIQNKSDQVINLSFTVFVTKLYNSLKDFVDLHVLKSAMCGPVCQSSTVICVRSDSSDSAEFVDHLTWLSWLSCPCVFVAARWKNRFFLRCHFLTTCLFQRLSLYLGEEYVGVFWRWFSGRATASTICQAHNLSNE